MKSKTKSKYFSQSIFVYFTVFTIAASGCQILNNTPYNAVQYDENITVEVDEGIATFHLHEYKNSQYWIKLEFIDGYRELTVRGHPVHEEMPLQVTFPLEPQMTRIFWIERGASYILWTKEETE